MRRFGQSEVFAISVPRTGHSGGVEPLGTRETCSSQSLPRMGPDRWLSLVGFACCLLIVLVAQPGGWRNKCIDGEFRCGCRCQHHRCWHLYFWEPGHAAEHRLNQSCFAEKHPEDLRKEKPLLPLQVKSRCHRSLQL